jgi:alpha-mannosidase
MKILHMIGHAHLDPVWLWHWTEGYQETKATFRSALDRMKEYDDFIFTQSSAVNYAWILENEPEMFKEIQERVAEGRWCIVGGWWTEPDCNIPSGESLVRQGLYGQRFFQEHFGTTAKVGFNADSFGHQSTIPQILKKSGMDSYVFMRPMPGEKALPANLFRWKSPDGSTVNAFRILFEYLSWGKEVDTHLERCAQQIKEEGLVFYGVGNHGGGPTKENIDSIHRLQKSLDQYDIRFSSPNQFFEEVQNKGYELPVYEGDLQHHASGCYSADSAVKRLNRLAENRLMVAEKMAAIAKHTMNYSTEKLDRAWTNLLFNQFHDTLAGTALETAYDDFRYEVMESMSIASRVENQSVQKMNWAINIPQEDMIPIVAWNPNTWEVQAPMEIEHYTSKFKGAKLVDSKGKEVAFQIIHPEAASNGRTRISFVSKLPSLGYEVFKLYPGQNDNEDVEVARASDDLVMENNWYKLSFCPETGHIKSWFVKDKEVEVFNGPAAVARVMEDLSDTWSHNVIHFDREIGRFSLDSIEKIEDGPVRTVIRVKQRYEDSLLIQDFIMYQAKERIDVRVTLDWHEKRKLLKLSFPINVIFSQANYEAAYGMIGREENGEEEPMQKWFDISGVVPGADKGFIHGLSILNDGKYSASTKTNRMDFTLTRSPIYAHHDPYVPKEDWDYRYVDQGEQRFNYSLYYHEGPVQNSRVAREAWEINQKPIMNFETFHEGPLAQRFSFLESDNEQIIVSVFKIAEDGEGYVLRAYESMNKAQSNRIRIPSLDVTIEENFQPGEIKTFLIKDKSYQEILMTELDKD